MARLPASLKRHPVVIALTVTASGLLLLLLALEYRPRIPVAGNGPGEARTPAASAAATDPLEISVFDQPRPLPEIVFADGDNRAVSLTGFRGRVVLLNLWATWCVPCRREIPSLDRVQARLGGDDFTVIALSLDRGGVPAVQRFYREVGVEKLGIYVDPSSRALHDLGAPGVPTTLLIDREGREAARKMGEAVWDGPEMVALIQRITAMKASDTGATR